MKLEKTTAKIPVIRRSVKTSQYEKSAAIGINVVQITLPINVYPTTALAPSHSANNPAGNEVTK